MFQGQVCRIEVNPAVYDAMDRTGRKSGWFVKLRDETSGKSDPVMFYLVDADRKEELKLSPKDVDESMTPSASLKPFRVTMVVPTDIMVERMGVDDGLMDAVHERYQRAVAR